MGISVAVNNGAYIVGRPSVNDIGWSGLLCFLGNVFADTGEKSRCNATG